nr:calmodulin [Hymenolepis microstoma]
MVSLILYLSILSLLTQTNNSLLQTDQITADQVSELFKTFSLFDRNQDGLITTDDLGTVMKSLGVNLSKKELMEMLKEGDFSGDGAIDFKEFVTLAINSVNDAENNEQLLNTFRLFDKDNNGFISPAELRQVLTALGEKLHEGQVEEMIRNIDRDRDGRINYDEFIRLIWLA